MFEAYCVSNQQITPKSFFRSKNPCYSTWKLNMKIFWHIMSTSKLLSVYFSVSSKRILKIPALSPLSKIYQIFLLLYDHSQDCKELGDVTQVLLLQIEKNSTSNYSSSRSKGKWTLKWSPSLGFCPKSVR